MLRFKKHKHKNENNNENDIDSDETGEKILDINWLQSAKACPILNDLEKDITDIDAYLKSKQYSVDPEGMYIYTSAVSSLFSSHFLYFIMNNASQY